MSLRIAFLLLFSITLVQSTSAQSVDTLWRARGLEAIDNIRALTKKKSRSPTEECKLQIEPAFALFSDPKSTDKLIKPVGDNTSFILVMFDEEKRPVDVRFFYEKDHKKPTRIGTGSLGEAWVFSVTPDLPAGTFVIQNKKCAYGFYPDDYFHPEIRAFN